MAPNARRIVAACLSLAVVLMLPASASAALTDQQRAERGTGFIAGMQRPNGSIPAFSPIGSTSDAVLAFVATGSGRPAMREALGYLRRQVAAGNVTGVGLQAKVVMAASAVGRDPRTFGGTNLLQAIRSQIGNDGHIDDAAVFDQALGVLAIEAAGVKPATSVTTLAAGRAVPRRWVVLRCALRAGHRRQPLRRRFGHRLLHLGFELHVLRRAGVGGGRSHVVGVGPVRVLRDGARSGPRRLVLLDRVHRHRRELDRPGAPGLHRRRRGDPDRWPEVVAHVAVPGVRRVGLHVGRRCEGRPRRGSRRSARSRPVAARRSR